MKFLEKCLGVLYPQTCYFCGRINKTPICSKCRGQIEYIEEPRCKKCGKPIRYEEQELCSDCKGQSLHYEQGRSVWLHKGPVRWSVYQFKYRNRRIYGKFYAQEMYRIYGEKLKEWEIDTIIPIPLHKRRQRKRGYNQAEIVAKYLGELTGIPVETKSLVRVRNTRPQKELNHKERNQNLKEAFEVTERWKVGKNVLLVDDIYTTGNTIDSAASVLAKKEAKKVWFLTISIGQGFQ